MSDLTSMNHRVWLRLSQETTGMTALAFLDLLAGIKVNNERVVDLRVKDLLKSIINNSDGYWYLPITGTLPSYVFEGKYARQTPDWGMGGRQMADILGGITKSIGNVVGEVSGTAGGFLKNIGSFFHAFTGDIDSPKIWESSEFKNIELGGKIAFESMPEFNYYKMAELWFTLMTMPSVAKKITAVSKFGKFINTSKGGPIQKYDVYAMQRPTSGIPEVDIIVGSAEELVRTGQAVKVDSGNSMILFSLDQMYLSSFSAVYGGEGMRGFDQNGVPRTMDFKLALEPMLLTSAILGLKRLLRANYNKFRTVKAVPALGVLEESAAGWPGTPQMPGVPPAEDQSLRSAVVRRRLRAAAPNLIRAVMYNVLNANLSLTAAAYVGSRARMTVGPVRVVVGPRGNSTMLPAGIPGLALNLGRGVYGTLEQAVT